MARFNYEEVDKYGNNGVAGFFSLKQDKDTALIRFLYDTINDIEGLSVHQIEVNGTKRYVNCLRNYNDPIDKCPLCAAKFKVMAKLFILLYDTEEQEIKVWDRGKTFFSKMASLCKHYKPLSGTVFEVERNGKKGDQKTQYELYEDESDGLTVEEFKKQMKLEFPEILGGIVLDKTYDELIYFLENGEFEFSDEEPSENERPIRRGKKGHVQRRRPVIAEEDEEKKEEKNNKPIRRTRRTPNKKVEEKEDKEIPF